MLAIAFVALLGASTSSLSPGYVFVTTAQGNGELDSWSEASGNFGTAAGDAICRSEAGNAGLPDSGTYIAALSDSGNDMFCRLNGLGGKYPFCGQSGMPSTGGPWRRLDGIPFTTLSLGVGGGAIATAAFDASGQLVDPPVEVFSGSEGMTYIGPYTGGSYSACSDWTAADTQFTGVGQSDGAQQLWSYQGGDLCSSTHHLLCMKSGASAPLNYAQRSGRVIFATQAAGNGNLSTWSEAGTATGVDAGDAICRTEAASFGLIAPQSFKAWLSDSTQLTPVNAIDRFSNDGPWVRSDGIPFAASRAALVAGNILAVPGRVPGAVALFTSSQMITGTSNAGLATGADCSGWTSADGGVNGTLGAGNITDQWSDQFASGCNGTFYRLYCFSDLDRIFDSSLEIAPY